MVRHLRVHDTVSEADCVDTYMSDAIIPSKIQAASHAAMGVHSPQSAKGNHDAPSHFSDLVSLT